MKKLILFAMLALPFFTTGQEKTVISYDRIFPKSDRIQAVEKALGAHALKYHTGDNSWRVYTIESGPDAGGYHIVEGPKTWDSVDKRGDLGAEHTLDLQKNIRPLLQERSSTNFAVYRADLSSVPITEHSTKLSIMHLYPRPGYSMDVEELIKKLKKTWEQSGQSVAVYETSSSGPDEWVLVTRYKTGLKERERDYGAPLKESYEKANGTGSWDAYIQTFRTAIDHSWSEILYYKAELSSR